MTCFVTKATPVHRKLHYVSKCNKLVQLVIQVKYHVNVIYSFGADTHTHARTHAHTHTHTHTHTGIPTSQTKVISRNQALWPACAWFNNLLNDN